MKLIVIDLDRCKWLKYGDLVKLNSQKICTLLPRDFGKKTLMKLPKGDPEVLRASRDYTEAIFTLKDDDLGLRHENKMFRDLLKAGKIRWFRVGLILRREKALKILQRLLKIG